MKVATLSPMRSELAFGYPVDQGKFVTTISIASLHGMKLDYNCKMINESIFIVQLIKASNATNINNSIKGYIKHYFF